MNVIRVFKNYGYDTKEKLFSRYLLMGQIKKFDDYRRREIYEKVVLSKKQQKEIDDLYITHYGRKVPYIWHRHYTAFTGKFDPTYLPEILYIPELERYLNPNVSYTETIADKNILPFIASSAGIKIPNTVISCVNGILRDKDNCIIPQTKALEILKSNNERMFIKPTIDSDSGRGCKVLEPNHSSEDWESIFRKGGRNFVIQDLVECHKSIQQIYPKSVNTFRIMTMVWNNNVISLPVIMRMGRGGNELDNAHAGGIFIAVDRDGSLHETAFSEFGDRLKEHPDTGTLFKGHKIDFFSKTVSAATKMHQMIPQIGIISWDFSIDKTGDPLLIEANTRYGGIWLIQEAHGCGIFQDKTPEILEWMKYMRKISPHCWHEHNGGIIV